MNHRWLNSFTLLAVILLSIGIIGAVERGNMVYDPGRPTSGWEWLLYLVAGALMLVNGLIPTNPDPEEVKRSEQKQKERE